MTQPIADVHALAAIVAIVARRPCLHDPPCPAAGATDREAAHTIATHPEQGWSLLCNGVVLFDDTGEILPDSSLIAPHRWIDEPRRSPWPTVAC
jgi:hypothetical protein